MIVLAAEGCLLVRRVETKGQNSVPVLLWDRGYPPSWHTWEHSRHEAGTVGVPLGVHAREAHQSLPQSWSPRMLKVVPTDMWLPRLLLPRETPEEALSVPTGSCRLRAGQSPWLLPKLATSN